MRVDTDLQPVSVACRPDPSPKEPERKTCAPEAYVSPFVWDQVDKLLFEPLSRVLSLEDWGEASNANSLDEVADSSWFVNKPRGESSHDDAPGACTPADMLADANFYNNLVARIPLGRIAEPEDVRNAVLFLVSQASDFITGQTIYLDGGITATQ